MHIGRLAVHRKLRNLWQQHRLLAPALGKVNAARFLAQQQWHRVRPPTRSYRVSTKHARHSLLCRPGTSDAKAFEMIFIQQEYSCVERLRDVRLVVDCGANVGYAAAYFLNMFPESTVFAVEPDRDNFSTLTQNLHPYAARARCVQAAVWSDATQLITDTETYRDGKEWSRQFRPCRSGEPPTTRGLPMDALLDEARAERVSLLKMDIEGAEAIVFGGTDRRWLTRVDAIVIELHDDYPHADCRAVFEQACANDFTLTSHGDLILGRRCA